MTSTEWFAPGTPVMGYDGEIGTVAGVHRDPTTTDVRSVMIQTVDGELIEVPSSLVDHEQSTDRLYLRASRDTLLHAGTTVADTRDVGDTIVVPVHEEHLVPTTHEVEFGQVRFHKRVETVPVETIVDVKHDEVAVERIAVNRPVEGGHIPAARHEGDTLIIPVLEEVIFTEKRLMLVEEIHVTQRQVSEEVPIQDSVRREYIEIERPSETSRAASTAAPDEAGNPGELPLT